MLTKCVSRLNITDSATKTIRNKQIKIFTRHHTVPFHSIRQSRITGPSKMPKCHGCHSDFHGVPNSFGNHVTNIANFSLPAALKLPKISQNLGMSRQLWEVAETKILGLPLDALGVYLPWLADNFPASSGKITFSQYFRIFSTSIG